LTRNVILLTVAVVAAGGSAVSGQARSTGPPAAGDRLVEAFLDELQRAVGRHDRRAVAAMIQYPLTAFAGGFPVPVRDPAALIELYDAFFTPELETVIALTGVARGGQQAPPYPIQTMPGGMMIGAGLLWAHRVGTGFKITRISLPSSLAGGRGRPEPRRVLFRAGQRSAQFSGALTPYQIQSYVIRAMKGQLLQVSIVGFRGRDALVRVFDQRSGDPVDVRAHDGARTWAGQVPASGDYRIDVVRVATDANAALVYKLVVTLQ